MFGRFYKKFKGVFSGKEDSLSSRNSMADVFRSYSPYGSSPAPWASDTREQVSHFRHWVYAAVRAIASRVAGTPLYFIRNDSGARLPASHPLNALMRSVNRFETSVSLWMKTLMYLELTGNAYWYVPKNIFGKAAEIWVIPSQYMRVVPDREKFIAGYCFSNGGIEESFSGSEIIHLKYPSPQSVFYGKSPLQAAASAVDSHEAMKESERRSFENGVFPGVAIKTSEKLSKDVRERLEASVRKGFSGPSRAGRAIILEQGLSMQPFTYSPREMDFLESSKITRDEILAVFGVPAAVAGISEDVNRASAEAMLFTFAQNTIIPKLRLLEAQLTQDLCSGFDSRIEARFEDPTPSVRAEDRADMVARIRHGITTPLEERERLGLKTSAKAISLNGSPKAEKDILAEQLAAAFKPVFAGQLKRIEKLSNEKGLSLDKAILAVTDDPSEPNRIEAPLSGELKHIFGSPQSKASGRSLTARALNYLRTNARNFKDNKKGITDLKEFFQEKLLGKVVRDAVMLSRNIS